MHRADEMDDRVHGTCVAIGSKGVLLLGAPGAGKSDLALRLISEPIAPFWATQEDCRLVVPLFGRLVADDQVLLRAVDGRLVACAPDPLYGKLEVRGRGIIAVQPVREIAVDLVVQLVHGASIDRFPSDGLTMTIAGLNLQLLHLDPFESSAPAKVALALHGPAPIS